MISEHNTADKRKEGREEQKIKGSSKAHVISFNPDGKTFQKWEIVRGFLDKKELELEEDEPDVNEMESDQFEEQEAEDQTWLVSIEVNDIYNMIEKESFVAIRTEPNTHDMLHAMIVQDKHIATENIEDASEEHCILKGEPYLVGKWFSFQKEARKFACFKELKNTE